MRRSFFTRSELAHVVLMVSMLVGFALFNTVSHTVVAQVNLKSGLMVTNRDALRVCLQLAPSTAKNTATIVKQMQANLHTVRQHPDWEAAGFGPQVRDVTVGCPGAKLPTTLVNKHAELGPGLTNAPSPYRSFIYVIDDQTATSVLGNAPAALASAEFMRAGEHVMAEVTTALVVRESALASSDFIDPWLTLAVGLEPSNAQETEAPTDAKYPPGHVIRDRTTK